MSLKKIPLEEKLRVQELFKCPPEITPIHQPGSLSWVWAVQAATLSIDWPNAPL